jgi:hypothetical protein
MVVDVKPAVGDIPGLYDVKLDSGAVLCDLTTAQVGDLIRREGTPQSPPMVSLGAPDGS